MGVSGITSGMGQYPNLLEALSTESGRRTAPTTLLEAMTSESSGGDVLDISPEAEAALQAAEQSLQDLRPLFLQSLFGDAGADGSISIKEMEASQQEAFDTVQGKLYSLFSENGIDTTQEIRLQVAGDGRVIVANDHPQKAQIEKMFADDSQLRNDFVRLTAMTEMVGAAREASAFQKAYAQDPYTAVAQYSYLFNSTQKAQVSISILDNQFQALYERPGGTSEAIGGE